ncbi:hypothetical protein [Rathayibacter rathayi]|uniref:hypothetical protein n=1 Tax=Rathayibacter rathayi TaxID=33887 RepID=UPI000CE74DDE|nr:hypothetical protein [Rathayibacter rathayi]PPG14408.1 hypothetical protein C5C11_05060 [Rathayibacter rathayi]
MLLRLALRVGRPQKLDLTIDVFVSCAMFRGLPAQTTPMTTGPRAAHSDSVPEILPAALAAEAAVYTDPAEVSSASPMVLASLITRLLHSAEAASAPERARVITSDGTEVLGTVALGPDNTDMIQLHSDDSRAVTPVGDRHHGSVAPSITSLTLTGAADGRHPRGSLEPATAISD